MAIKVVAITGSYRRGQIIDSMVEAILEGAREMGAETHTIRLLDQHIEFCTNCRACTQEPGTHRGACVHKDDLEAILSRIDAADAIVLGAPVNAFNVTAIFRRFLERLTVYAYWPWSKPSGPVLRTKHMAKKALLVSSAAMPGFLLPLATGSPRALKLAAKQLGARPIGKLWIGLSAVDQHQQPAAKTLSRARGMGRELVQRSGTGPER